MQVLVQDLSVSATHRALPGSLAPHAGCADMTFPKAGLAGSKTGFQPHRNQIAVLRKTGSMRILCPDKKVGVTFRKCG